MTKKQSKSSGAPSWKRKQKEERKEQRTKERLRKVQDAAVEAEAHQTIAQILKSHPWPHARQPTESREQYRFLNPYNFVRYLPEPNIAPGDVDAQLLGRCLPPPHDRYVGLTGRITCQLEVVTPLFIADSHDVTVTTVRLADGREVEHKSYRFFQYGGQDAIPAASLRGMVRSLFEAVTNSPFSVFDGDQRLEYRIDLAEARRFKAGIVRSLPKDDQPGVIALCEEAKVGAYYDDPTGNVLDDSWSCGEKAWAIVGRTKNNVPRVDVLVRERAALAGGGDSVHHGWVKVTGRTIDTKRNESFFYFKRDPAHAKTVYFDVERQADFDTILAAQLHDRSEDFHTEVQTGQLAPGNLVYVELDGERKDWVRNIALARVARLRYRHAIGDLLPDHLKPSESYDILDIASRVFGWVKPTREEDRRARIAYASRVRFSHAVLTKDGDNGAYDKEIPLAILGEPKPTTTLFYLQAKEGDWSEDERKKPGAAETIGYDGQNVLRGRKVYRHHGAALNRLEYERAAKKQDHQNRSVRGVRAPGNVFEFTIQFHNLAPLELGALLWTLKLNEEGCHFRLGYAKPLGFGSIKLAVDRVELIDVSRRYQTLAENGRRFAEVGERGGWLARFEMAMERCYGKPLRQLDNIKDLIALLREPENASSLHVHYPRTGVTPDPEGKNFEWFVANKAKSTNSDKAGPNLTLGLPGDEHGLPPLP